MRGLKICLWISGILCLLEGAGVFLPVSAIESFCTWMGLESFPDSALFIYGIRVMSAMAVGIGVFFIILAMDPMKYGILVPFSGIAAIVLGFICAIVGISVKMQALWFWSDFLCCFVIGILILIFWRQSRQKST